MKSTFSNVMRWLKDEQPSEMGELRGRLIVITVTNLSQLTDSKTLGYIVLDEREAVEAVEAVTGNDLQETLADLHNHTQRCIKLILRRGQPGQSGH